MVFAQGLRESGRFCRLIASSGEGLIGIATAKKIGAKPRRNRAKRRVREAIRPLAERNELLDSVVVVTVAALDCPFEDLQNELRELFGRMNARWAESLESS